MNRRRPQSGFALLEILFTIVIVGVAAVIAARLFATAARTYRQTADATNALRSQRQWLTQMRDDAWAATTATADDASTASFVLSEGAATWAWSEASLTRTLGDDVRRWPVSHAMRWRLDRRSLVVIGDVEVPLATPSLRLEEAR